MTEQSVLPPKPFAIIQIALMIIAYHISQSPCQWGVIHFLPFIINNLKLFFGIFQFGLNTISVPSRF